MKIVIVGHVDHGKSTLIGRLLLDTGSLSEDKIQAFKEASDAPDSEAELAHLLDQLQEERLNNMTIDTTQVFLNTKKRPYVIIDAPGHKEFLNNMITGVSEGYAKVLSIEGVGYRASMQGKNLNLALGFSHPVTVEAPDGIKFEVDGTQTIKVSGIDKQLVGQTAANVRALRKPEPYKGKGVRYQNEHVRRKVGKAGAK